jgi:hypothetical protein
MSGPHVKVEVQPHPFGPALPPPHVLGEVHVSGQVMFCPQLFVLGPHATPAQVAPVESAKQPHPFGPAPPPPHVLGATQ